MSTSKIVPIGATPIDFSADAELFSEDARAKCVQLGEDLARQDQRVEDLEAELELAKSAQRHIATEVLVTAMDNAGLAEFTLRSGFAVKVKPLIEGSIPNSDKYPERNAAALQSLRDTGHEKLIKRYLSLGFDKGEDVLAQRVRNAIEAVLKEANVKRLIEDESSVHHSTLKAFAREMLEAGEAIDTEVLGLWVGRKATIIKPKQKKK